MTYEERIEKIKAAIGHDSGCSRHVLHPCNVCTCRLDERARAADAVWLEATERPTSDMATAGAVTRVTVQIGSHAMSGQIGNHSASDAWEKMHAAIPRAPVVKDDKP